MKTLFKSILLTLPFVMVACQQSANKPVAEADPDPANQTLETIFARTSVRNYTDKAVSADTLQLLVKAGMAAPSGRDKRPWEFVVITDRATLDTLASRLPYAKMLVKAPAAIAVLGNVNQSSYWYLDCSAATENILLAAQALGLGAVWTATYPYEDRMAVVNDVLQIPDSVQSLSVIPVGYPKGNTKPKDKWNESKIHYNKW